MIWIERLSLFSAWDFISLACYILGWMWIGWRIENPSKSRPSVSLLMADFRREWMKEMVTRSPRIFDSQVISSLRQATAFFASASMLALGAGLALIGNTEQLAGVAQDLALGQTPDFVWEIKILLVLAALTNAFLAFVWSHRLFGYCSVLMAAVPNEPGDPAPIRGRNKPLKSTSRRHAVSIAVCGPPISRLPGWRGWWAPRRSSSPP